MCAVEYARWDAGLWDAVGAAGRDAGCDVGRDDVCGAGLVVMGDIWRRELRDAGWGYV